MPKFTKRQLAAIHEYSDALSDAIANKDEIVSIAIDTAQIIEKILIKKSKEA